MHNGEDERRSRGAAVTYRHMLLQIARDYPGLPDPRTLTVAEIVFFYDGLRPELTKYTAPKPPRRHG